MRRARERPWRQVPWLLWLLLGLGLLGQIGSALQRPPHAARATALTALPATDVLRVFALGEPALAARVLMLWLQAQDHQPGLSLPYAALDYARVEAWLARLLELDARFDYPLLAASRLYGEVAEPNRQHRMIAFIARAFAEDPAARWRWQAHAVYLAQHRLRDLPLALGLAQQLAAAPGGATIPSWARQMHIFVLENMGELDSARVVLGGLLESGALVDAHERAFLARRLRELEAAVQSAPSPASKE